MTMMNRTRSLSLAVVALTIALSVSAHPNRLQKESTLRGTAVSSPAFEHQTLDTVRQHIHIEHRTLDEEEEEYSYDSEDDDNNANNDDEGDYESKDNNDDDANSKWSAKSSAKNMFELAPHQWSPLQWFFFSLMMLAIAMLSCCCCVLCIIPRLCGQKGSMMYAAMLS